MTEHSADSPAPLTRRQLRELREAEAAASATAEQVSDAVDTVVTDVPPAPPAAENVADTADVPDIVELPDATEVIEIVTSDDDADLPLDAVAAADEVAADDAVDTGVVVHEAPTFGHDPAGVGADSGIVTRVETAHEEEAPASTGVSALTGRRALRRARTEGFPIAVPITQVIDADDVADLVADDSTATTVEPVIEQTPAAPVNIIPPAGDDVSDVASEADAAEEEPEVTAGPVNIASVFAPAAPSAGPAPVTSIVWGADEGADAEDEPALNTNTDSLFGEEVSVAVQPDGDDIAYVEVPGVAEGADVVPDITDAITVAPAVEAAKLDEVDSATGEPQWTAPDDRLSFDDIIAPRPRGTSTSALSTALIFNPGDVNRTLTGPIPQTGDMLVTGSYPIAAGIASHGYTDGAIDDAATDSVLLDREIPAASSPTPVAAKSAVSRSSFGPELVRPAEPEETSRLTIALVVTGGLLLAAALTTLVVGMMTGAFS